MSFITSAATLGTFAVLLLLSLFGLQTIYWSFVVVMIMAISFVMGMASVFVSAHEKNKLYATIGLIFAIMFSIFISIAYYLQLTVVRPNPLDISPQVIELIAYSPGSLAFSLDMLGFTFLCLSLFALIPIYGTIKDRQLKVFLWVNALLALPTFAFPIFFVTSAPPNDTTGSIALFIWCLIFLPVPALLASRIKRG